MLSTSPTCHQLGIPRLLELPSSSSSSSAPGTLVSPDSSYTTTEAIDRVYTGSSPRALWLPSIIGSSTPDLVLDRTAKAAREMLTSGVPLSGDDGPWLERQCTARDFVVGPDGHCQNGTPSSNNNRYRIKSQIDNNKCMQYFIIVHYNFANIFATITSCKFFAQMLLTINLFSNSFHCKFIRQPEVNGRIVKLASSTR